MKIEEFALDCSHEPLVIRVDRSVRQPDRGYTYGNLYNKTYCREVNIGPSEYDLLRDVEFLVFTLSSGSKTCKEIFDHFLRIDSSGVSGQSEFNRFLGLEDLREVFRQRKALPGILQDKRIFGWQSLMYPPRTHPANPALFIPYIDVDEDDWGIDYRKSHREYFVEGKWLPYDYHAWQDKVFLSPRFRKVETS